MARKRPASEEQSDNKASRRQVTLDADLYRKAKVIAAALDVTMPDWINARLREVIDRELPAVLADLGQPRPEKH